MSWLNRKLSKAASEIAAALKASGDLPVGEIRAYGGSTAPDKHLLCDGSAVSRTTYADLFAVISTTYGVGDGSTTFNLPDLRGRFPLGKAAAGTGSTLGGTGGALDHNHSISTLLATTKKHYHGKGDLHIHTAARNSGTGTAHTHTIASSGTHQHTVKAEKNNNDGTGNYTLQSGGPYDLTSYITGTGAHTHSPANESAHTHSIAHTHDSTEFDGSVGSLSGSGGVSGDSDQACTMSGAMGTNNPAFQAVNYIIRY